MLSPNFCIKPHPQDLGSCAEEQEEEGMEDSKKAATETVSSRTGGLVHIRARRSCGGMHKTCPSSSQTKLQQGLKILEDPIGCRCWLGLYAHLCVGNREKKKSMSATRSRVTSSDLRPSTEPHLFLHFPLVLPWRPRPHRKAFEKSKLLVFLWTKEMSGPSSPTSLPSFGLWNVTMSTSQHS